jgi:uncharacterized lipoprotein YmbA
MTRAMLGLAACLGLAGCLSLGGEPLPVRLFVLEPVAAAPAAGDAAGAAVAVGVGPLTLPDYAGSRLVHRVGPNEVRLSDTDRWAEPLAAGLQRVLVTNLSVLLGSERVVAHPWRPEVRPTWRIEIDVLRLERSAEGAADLEARWTLRRSRDLALVRQGTTRLVRAPQGASAEALVAALSAAVAEWSGELAAAVRDASRQPTGRSSLSTSRGRACQLSRTVPEVDTRSMNSKNAWRVPSGSSTCG